MEDESDTETIVSDGKLWKPRRTLRKYVLMGGVRIFVLLTAVPQPPRCCPSTRIPSYRDVPRDWWG